MKILGWIRLRLALRRAVCMALNSGLEQPEVTLDWVADGDHQMGVPFYGVPHRLGSVDEVLKGVSPGASVYLVLHKPPTFRDLEIDGRRATEFEALSAYVTLARNVARQRGFTLKVALVGFALNPEFDWMRDALVELVGDTESVLLQKELFADLARQRLPKRCRPEVVVGWSFLGLRRCLSSFTSLF
ncbi:MAG: hypothetical protein U0136_09060 [Bdellovibrionota bacterium]